MKLLPSSAEQPSVIFFLSSRTDTTQKNVLTAHAQARRRRQSMRRWGLPLVWLLPGRCFDLDRAVRQLIAKLPEGEMENCALSHLYMIRWDDQGMPSAYGLLQQKECKGTADNHKRDRKIMWAKRTMQRLREATSVYSPERVPISRTLAGTAGLWWADDYLYWVNRLLDDADCSARIFVFTANVSQSCQVLVPALFEYDIAQEQVNRLRRTEAMAMPWISRRPQLFYRGKDFAPESCAMYLPPNYRPRRKLDLLSRKYPEVINASIHKQDAVDSSYFAKYRYVVDIGGVSCTTWSALHWKLSSGSLVLVVEHPGGLINYWTKNTLRPWVHYVPIKFDYSDLFDILRYFEHHPEAATAIAVRGQRAALEYTQAQAFDALGNVLTDALHSERQPPALVRYPHEPLIDDLWYCAVGSSQGCEIRYY